MTDILPHLRNHLRSTMYIKSVHGDLKENDEY